MAYVRAVVGFSLAGIASSTLHPAYWSQLRERPSQKLESNCDLQSGSPLDHWRNHLDFMPRILCKWATLMFRRQMHLLCGVISSESISQSISIFIEA